MLVHRFGGVGGKPQANVLGMVHKTSNTGIADSGMFN